MLVIFIMLYIIFLELIYFIIGSLYISTDFIQFPSTVTLSGNHKSELFLRRFVCFKYSWIPDHLICLLRNLYEVRKQQLELDMEQQTGSK